jgi:hypothetical protein
VDIKTTLKASVAAAALVAVSAPVVSSTAAAGTISNGNDNAVVISGGLVRSLQVVDTGGDTGMANVDGGNDTNSRMRILVNGDLTESVKVGGVWEANLPSSNSAGNSVFAKAGDSVAGDVGAFGFRKTDITFTHASLGKLSIGQNSTSSDNKPSLDSTGNNNAGMNGAGKALVFNGTTQANTAFTAADQFSSYFGGRADRVRYDTPDMGGFQLSGSLIGDSTWDAGLTYGATYGDFQIAAAAQYATSQSATVEASYGAGIAVKHSSGISAGYHYGTESTENTAISGSSWHAEIGYVTSSLSNMGDSAITVVYSSADETLVDGMEAENIAVHLRQNMPAGVQIFAMVEQASFDDATANSYDDVTAAMIGTYIGF